jgi:GTP-binding protein EngB required for normal cell division
MGFDAQYSLNELIKIKFSSYSLNPATFQKQSILLLTIGKSGAGKSTFVNYLCNFLHGVQYNDPKLFVIPDENFKCNVKEYIGHNMEIGIDQTTSKTQQCFAYKFENYNRVVTIIDTPGYNDTRGYAQDKINIESISKAIDTHVDINAICFVIPINDYRASITTKFYIEEIKKLLPKDFENFIICFTFSSCSDEDKALTCVKNLGLNTVYHYKFEFYPLITTNVKTDTNSLKIWIENEKKCEDLLTTAFKLPIFTSVAFKKVATTRAELRKVISEVSGDTYSIDILVKQYKEDKIRFNKSIKAIESLVDTQGPKDTCCVDCGAVCHKGCKLDSVYISIGDKALSSCACMANNHCNKCKCAREAHYHTEYRYLAISTLEFVQIHKELPCTIRVTNACKHSLMNCTKQISDLRKIREINLKLLKEKKDELKKIALLPSNKHIIEYLDNQLDDPDTMVCLEANKLKANLLIQKDLIGKSALFA